MSAGENDKLIGAYVPIPLAKAVENAAAAQGISKSTLIRRSLAPSLIGGQEMTVWLREDMPDFLMKERRSKAPRLGDAMPDGLVAFRRVLEGRADEPFVKGYAADDANALSVEDTAPAHPPILCPTCGKVAGPKAIARHMRRTGHGEAPQPEYVPNEHVAGNPDGEYDMPITKALMKPEQRYTLAPLYSPGRLDAHGEWADADALQEALWGYMQKGYHKLHRQHGDKVIGEVVEAFQWPYDHEAELQKSDGTKQTVKLPAGTVYCGVRWEPDAWADVKAGRITGLSMGGTCTKVIEGLPS